MTPEYREDIVLLDNIQQNMKLLSCAAQMHLLYCLQDLLDFRVQVSVSKIREGVLEAVSLLKMIEESKKQEN